MPDPTAPDPNLIESFPNPNPDRDFVIEHIADEFTSVCPKTGHPDFGTVTLQYIPGADCVELKSLKLYYQSFRNAGIYYEAVTNRIADDLEAAMKPVWMMLRTDWNGRGGIRSTITVEVGQHPRDMPGTGPGGPYADDDEDEYAPPPPGY
ncbi:MAG: preQ(1) synthase [Planctomycetota bacterium]